MELEKYFQSIVGQEESDILEYKATLIPSKSLAQILASFANTRGGSLIFGVRIKPRLPLEIQGISSDFNIPGIVMKAISMLLPQADIFHKYFVYDDKQLYGIRVQKSKSPILVEGAFFKREGAASINQDQKSLFTSKLNTPEFDTFKAMLHLEKGHATAAKSQLLDHYLNILKLYEPTIDKLFPESINEKTQVVEGKLFNRILFASCIDNFETYLSQLLYEIYLAKPDTLKGGESTVRVADVLDCSDIDDFIQKFAARRVTKLQKGSIKGFLKDTQEFSCLDALSNDELSEIEKILQIRHLYTHRNGIVDEAFLFYFRKSYSINEEHQLTIFEILEILEFLIKMATQIDKKAVDKYSLSLQSN